MTTKKEIFGWSMYDFANTIFSALFVTVYFPLLVVLKGGTPFHVGLVVSASMLVAAFLVPFLGAIADITKRKKIMLIIFTSLCCLATLFVGFFGLVAVLILALLANFFYHASLDVYDAMLVDMSHRKNIGWISGLGTGVGYLGTIFAVGIAFLVGRYYGYETLSGINIVLVLTAIMFFGFALFTFAYVKEKSKMKIEGKHLKQAAYRVVYTLTNIKKFKRVWIFLLASLLYTDGASTAIVFLFLFGRDQVGLSLVQFLPIFAIMATASAIGAFSFGKVTDKFGHKKTLTAVLIAWMAVIFILYLKTSFTTFVIVGILGGVLLGALWTITRPMLVQIVPKEKVAELFGYQGLTEKFSGLLGPALFGFIATFVGFREALLVVIALFLLGVIALSFVKIGNQWQKKSPQE